MAEEVTWVIESWEVWWNLKEWVTEADVQRIQENSHQMIIRYIFYNNRPKN